MAGFGRISGIASGFDTETFINDIMRAQRIPVDRLVQKKQVLEWQRDDYREINRAILAFRNNFSFNMRLQSTYLAKAATSTNENVLIASATANTQNASYQVTVSELAQAAYNNSSGAISASADNRIEQGAVLWTQMDRFASWEIGDIEGEVITVTAENSGTAFRLEHQFIAAKDAGDMTVTVDGAEYDVYYNRDDFEAAEGTDKVLVDTKAGKLTFAEKIEEGTEIKAGYSYYNNKFSVTTFDQAGKEITRDFTIDFGKDNLYSVLAAINADKDLGLTAYYDESSDRVSIATSYTGANNPEGPQIMVGETGFLAETLKINTANEEGGTDAKIIVNGLEINRGSNDFTLNGVNFSLKEVGTTRVTVTSDTDKVMESITNFVDEYNKVLLMINEKVNEPYHRDYPPLTDEQRDQLSDKQIEKWDELSRTGHLRNDAILRNISVEMRTAMSGRITGGVKFSSLAAIGITTGDYREQGTLHINEDKLRAALEEDPEAVMNLFTAEGTGNKEGIARRIDESLKGALDKLTRKAGNPDSLLYDDSFASKSIRDIEKQIDRLEDRMLLVEERYWRQFTAMEQALSRMYAQEDWLQMQIMSLMG